MKKVIGFSMPMKKFFSGLIVIGIFQIKWKKCNEKKDIVTLMKRRIL